MGITSQISLAIDEACKILSKRAEHCPLTMTGLASCDDKCEIDGGLIEFRGFASCGCDDKCEAEWIMNEFEECWRRFFLRNSGSLSDSLDVACSTLCEYYNGPPSIDDCDKEVWDMAKQIECKNIYPAYEYVPCWRLFLMKRAREK